MINSLAKYVVVPHHIMGEQMIIFHCGIKHSDMAPKNEKPISAGMVAIDDTGVPYCEMGSSSLKITRNEEREKQDDFLVRSMFRKL